jgi:hypothetical protein
MALQEKRKKEVPRIASHDKGIRVIYKNNCRKSATPFQTLGNRFFK